MWICAGNITELYRAYREYKDNQTLGRLYPANKDYRDRALVLSDYCDIMAYNIAKQWAEYEPNVNTVITHLKSLCHRLYGNKVYLQHATALYTSHYYNPATGKWLYRDGTTWDVIRPGYIPKETKGCGLLTDIKSSEYDGWV